MKYIARTAAVLLLAFGIYSTVASGYLSRVSMITNINSIGQPPARSEIVENRSTLQTQPPRREMNRPRDNAPGFPPGPPNARRTGGFNTLASYLGILSAFTIITFYTDKLLVKTIRRTG